MSNRTTFIQYDDNYNYEFNQRNKDGYQTIIVKDKKDDNWYSLFVLDKPITEKEVWFINYNYMEEVLNINGDKYEATMKRCQKVKEDDSSSYEEFDDAPQLSSYQHKEKLPGWIQQQMEGEKMEEELTIENCISEEDQKYFKVTNNITENQYKSLKKAWFDSKMIGKPEKTTKYWSKRAAILKSLFMSQTMNEIDKDKYLDGIAHNMGIDKKELIRTYKKYLYKKYPALTALYK